MKENVIRTKSFQFAVNTVLMFKSLQEVKREFIISKQFVRSGTSIGANVREGVNENEMIQMKNNEKELMRIIRSIIITTKRNLKIL